MAVKVRPGARHAGIDGVVDLAGGDVALKVRVTAPPEGGKANAAVVALLAKAWGLPKSAIEVAAGASDRNKVLCVAGQPRELKARLERWLAGS